MTIALAIGFGLLTILVMWLQMSGKIKDMPGWV
jgi:hypothetical protein